MPVPPGIDIAHYSREAKELLRDALAQKSEALDRFRNHHPERLLPDREPYLQLGDASLVIARENGFATWMRFVEYLVFRNAVDALDMGDVPRLRNLIENRKTVGLYRCHTGELYETGYFAGARLLWHVAGNPDRGPLPKNIVEVAALILEFYASKEDVEATEALVLTSRRASEAGVALPLLDVLHGNGGFDVSTPGLLDGPLLNAAPATAEALMARGALPELRHAAALGDAASVARLLDTPDAHHDLETALAFACIRGRRETAALLIARGAKGDVLVSPGGQTPRTALHEAANRGHTELVLMMLDGGADPMVTEPRWSGAPSDWAKHGGFPELAALLRQRERRARH